jgi:hypothetical protein
MNIGQSIYIRTPSGTLKYNVVDRTYKSINIRLDYDEHVSTLNSSPFWIPISALYEEGGVFVIMEWFKKYGYRNQLISLGFKL